MNLALSLLSTAVLNVGTVGAGQSAPARNPAEIFHDVCLQGSSSFGAGQLVQVEVMTLPWSLRTGISHFDHRTPRTRRFGAPGSDSRFYRIVGADAYLLIPERTSGPCAVFWEGGHWDEVRGALDGWIAVPATDFLRTRGGDVWMETDLDGHAVAVAGYQGWIMMRAEPLDRLKPEESVN